MKKLLIVAMALMNTMAFAEMKLESSEIIFGSPKLTKSLDNGQELNIFPAVVKLIEIDDQTGVVRQTLIETELNQRTKMLSGSILANNPSADPGPWMILGIGFGRGQMKITGLRGKTINDIFDTSFKGRKSVVGFIWTSTNQETVNSKDIKIIQDHSKGVGAGIEEVMLSLSTKNIIVTVANEKVEKKLSFDDVKNNVLR
jgi:hypothetical protein